MSTGAGELVAHPKTLYVGNLDPSVSEDFLCTLFSQIGNVKGCKIIREIAFTLLSVLLIGQEACAVINQSSAQSTSDKATSERKGEIAAEDRIISDVYGAPPQLSNNYGPPIGGGGFNGPAPVYGPPEFTGHHGPVQVHPPPPPELPPPPPHSHGPPRKPKPHYGPPKTPFGPPPLSFGPKPIYGPPKLHFGPPPPSFGSPKPQYGPPLKVSGPVNHQFRPPRFEGHQNTGHGLPIPTSLEQYGPPNREASLSFGVSQKDFASSQASSILSLQGHHGSQSAGDLYGPPPPPPPPGVPAPPTPPDIKYDGWQPIAGLVGAPHNHDSQDTYRPPDSANGHLVSQSLGVESSVSHSSGSHSSSLVIENPKHNVPSNSYGEPIHNQDAQHLKTSVYQSTNSHGLPPPPLPQSEPIHTDQGLNHGIAGHQEHQQHFESNHQHNHFGNSDLSTTQFDHSISTDLKVPAFEILPEAGALTGNPHGLSHGDESNSAFGGSSSSFTSSGSTLSLPTLSLDTDATFSTSNGHQHASHAFHAGGDDLTLQRLPLHGPSTSFSGSSFGGRGHGHGKPGPSPHIVDSYGAPPASSYSPSGRYPAPHGHRGGSWHSGFNTLSSSGFSKHHGNGNSHHRHRSHGPPLRYGPPPSVTGFMIPPRNRAPIKFREQIPAVLLANINRYLSPIAKPSINYGAPIEQQLPSPNGLHSFKSSSSSSFGSSLSSGNSFAKGNSLFVNAPIAAPHVQYGTPLSFGDFNTPAPIRTYGAPNFAPTNSFVSTSFGGFGSVGNLYKNIASNAITATYGTPVHDGAASIHTGAGILGQRDCSFQKSTGLGGQHSSFVQDAGHFTNLLQSSELAGTINSGHGNANQQFTILQTPSIHELDLESHEQQQGELKDSYGNPITLSIESVDQAGAAFTNNDIRAQSVLSSSGYSSHEDVEHRSHGQRQNSYSAGSTFSNGGDISAEALTAALTAQGFGQSKNYVSNELAQDSSNRYTSVQAEGNEALALALQAEGANDFQIQGSKGTYTLQIQSADGSRGTENSDGTIRHDEVLSNGLLQDILAAIEQPVDGPVQIQGAPQPQQLQEVYGDAIANAAHQQQVSINHQRTQDIIGSHNDIIQQVLAFQGNDGGLDNIEKSLTGEEQVALFYDNNSGYENSKKDIRSTAKSEAQAATTGSENTDDNQTSNSRVDATKKTS